MLFLGAAMVASSQDAAPAPPPAEENVGPVKPSVIKIDEDRFKIGEVTFDKKLREIRFPARINMVEGQLEYLIVHENGKVHEALLATKISPTHLNLAFTLLRYKPSAELYPLPNDTGGTSNKFPEVSAEVKAAARIQIEVEWEDAGKKRKLPINEWIQHGTKGTDMPAGPWVYGASVVEDGKYAPETSGDVAAIFLSAAAIINYPGDDNNNDDVWTPFPKRVPAEGSPVTVIISPYSKEPANPTKTDPDPTKPKS